MFKMDDTGQQVEAEQNETSISVSICDQVDARMANSDFPEDLVYITHLQNWLLNCVRHVAQPPQPPGRNAPAVLNMMHAPSCQTLELMDRGC